MNRGLGSILLNFSVAIYLLATGILGVTGNWFKGGEIRQAVNALFGHGNFADILIIVLGIIAIAAGVFILMKFFGVEIPAMELLLIIMAIVWIIFIILIDIIRPLNSNGTNFVDWLRSFGAHLMALAGIILATSRFGLK